MPGQPGSLKSLLGIELPIIQAPMAGAQGSALAVAVCNAGGLGSLPCAMLSHEAMRAEMTAIREQTTRPFNANFFCHIQPPFDAEREDAWRSQLAPYYRELGLETTDAQPGSERAPFDPDAIDVLMEFRPEVVSFHFGLPPADLLDRIRAYGGKILSSATTVEEAVWLESKGADLIVAQGVEAGGHRGMFLSDDLTTQRGTFDLLPQILDAVSVPVVAAGGIATGKEVAAAIAMGAAGVQIGTAYLLCPEVSIRPAHRAALMSPLAQHTALTNVFTGRPARSIVNRLIKELGPINPDAPAFPWAARSIAPLRAKGDSLGIPDYSPLWAGQNAGQCREIPAAQLTRDLAAQLEN